MKLIERIVNYRIERDIARQTEFPVKIVSIGNITVGGAGKTPFTIKTSRLLTSMGIKNAIVTRGYRGHYRDRLLVSDGNEILTGWREASDEAILLAMRTEVPVAVSRKRARGIRLILDRFPETEVILLDDAFSHLKVKRDLDILIIDAWRRLSGERLIPLGALREPLENIRRADLYYMNNRGPFFAENREFLKEAFGIVTNEFFYKTLGFYNMLGDEIEPGVLKSKPIIAMAGIAHPSSFFKALEEEGIKLKARIGLPDHFSYPSFTKKILGFLTGRKGILIVTTEKDMVKLLDLPEDVKSRIIYPKIDLVFEGGSESALVEKIKDGKEVS